VRDPEFGLRLLGLNRQRGENRERPLVVVLGSSRISMGLRPAVLSRWQEEDKKAPIIFNSSLVGSGPILELLCLDRLLARGIRPDLVVAEFWPPFYQPAGPRAEESLIDVNRLDHRDVRLLRRYFTDPDALVRHWLQGQLMPFSSHRFVLLSHYAPIWLAWAAREDHKWMGLDNCGWLPLPGTVTSAQHDERVQKGLAFFRPALKSAFLGGKSDRALRELVARCRREHINVVLLFMPEASVFRDLYGPAMQMKVDDYLDGLQRELGLPIVNARRWSRDDDFIDSFHLLPRGAAAFTRRFAREAVMPMLEAKLGLVAK
jgi:hypothetical protein